MTTGRKPLGPALVAHLEGSMSAKARLELILKTLAGQVSVVAASQQLGISEAMFYKVRNRVLQVCLEDLEPKPLGRPPQRQTRAEQRSAELAAEVSALQRELTAQTVRLEVGQVLPQRIGPSTTDSVKKTTRGKPSQRARRRGRPPAPR